MFVPVWMVLIFVVGSIVFGFVFENRIARLREELDERRINQELHIADEFDEAESSF